MKKGVTIFLSAVIGATTGALGSAINVYRRERRKLNMEETANRKNDAILKAYAHWMQRKQRGESLVDYLEKMGYKKIAIYGMHYLGESLLSELNGSNIEVECAIDKNAELRYADIPIYTLDKDIPNVDAIIVTAFFYFDEIKEMLLEKTSCPIVSIEDIIYE